MGCLVEKLAQDGTSAEKASVHLADAFLLALGSAQISPPLVS